MIGVLAFIAALAFWARLIRATDPISGEIALAGLVVSALVGVGWGLAHGFW